MASEPFGELCRDCYCVDVLCDFACKVAEFALCRIDVDHVLHVGRNVDVVVDRAEDFDSVCFRRGSIGVIAIEIAAVLVCTDVARLSRVRFETDDLDFRRVCVGGIFLRTCFLRSRYDALKDVVFAPRCHNTFEGYCVYKWCVDC